MREKPNVGGIQFKTKKEFYSQVLCWSRQNAVTTE